jgi:two-component system response regulator RpfG
LSSEPRSTNPLLGLFAARIRSALDARRVIATAEGRATALANRMGRSVSSATRWLNGEMLPSLETLVDISGAYDVSLDYLLGLSTHDRGLGEDRGLARDESPRVPQPILIVDDQSTARRILNEIAASADTQTTPVVFGGAAEALRWASAYHADLVITDYRLPGTDGLEFVRHLRKLSHFADVPVLMVTIVEDKDLRYRALRQGINDFLLKPIDPHEGLARCRNLLAMFRHQALLRDRSALLAGLVHQKTAHARDRERQSLMLLAHLVESRNGEDANHAERIAALAGLIAREIGLEQEEADAVELGAALHDVGTLTLSDTVIGEAKGGRGPHPVSFRAHAALGYQVLKGRTMEPFRTAALIALGHHEWFNGLGYPTGLRADHIPLAARIVAVADRIDSLFLGPEGSRRDAAWATLAADRSIRLDSELVDVVLEAREEIEQIYRRFPPDRASGVPGVGAGDAGST